MGDSDLRRIAEKGRLAPERAKVGREVSDAIFEALKQEPTLSVDRVCIAGSVGKGTAVTDSDFDLVIFLNKERPPWSSEVKGAFKKALESAKIPNNGSLKMEETSYCIMTEVSIGRDTYGFDVVLASALIAGGPPEKQLSEIKSAMGAGEGDSQHADSGGMAESVVAFFKKLSPDMLALIRLAKMWDRGVDFPKDTKICGRSYLIELIVIYSTTGCQNLALKDGFIKFLEQMQQLGKAKIGFTDFYAPADVPADINNKGLPIIMDLVNPYNNLGKQFHGDSGSSNAQVYRKEATDTLNKIRDGRLPEAWFPLWFQ